MNVSYIMHVSEVKVGDTALCQTWPSENIVKKNFWGCTF